MVGTVGRVLILPENIEPGIINPRLVKLSLHREINREYIRIFLNSPVVEEMIKAYFHGSTMHIINLGILKSIFFPLPPVKEQRRIVEKVDELMKLLNDLEEKVKDNQKNCEFLMQAVLKEAFASQIEKV